MKSYPLKSNTIEEAMELQFKLVDTITHHFSGYEILSRGDLGVNKNGNIPQTTFKVEKVIASFFESEAAVLVRGAGTNAIRESLAVLCEDNRTLFVHDAPIYSTTLTTIIQLNLNYIQVNFNDLEELEIKIQNHPEVKVALVQLTRQKLDDSYDYKTVIDLFKKYNVAVLTDDNYAVMKVDTIGSQCGADLSSFSCFKLLGPQGIGCIVGSKIYIDKIRKFHYSGGSQVQGFEALEVLQGLIYAPVALAIQAVQIDKVVNQLNHQFNEVVKQAYIVNAQSKVILVELNKPIAKQVIIAAEKLGALPHPVGSESKFEFSPLFYKVSGTMLEANPDAIDYFIRINPMRAGAETILRILEEAIRRVIACS